MGLWDGLLRVLGFGGEAAKSPDKPQMRTARKKALEPGSIQAGMVSHVGDRFVKIEAGSFGAVVFMNEMAGHFVTSPHEILSEGERVEFVLLEPSTKKPGDWVVSLSAVEEARARQALSRVEAGELRVGRVVELRDKGAVLELDGAEGWLPLREIAWRWVSHPAEALALGDEATVKVLRVDLPDNWLRDKRARRARMTVSRRACLPQPPSPPVQMPFRCLPFKVWVVPKKPRDCDPVVLHVLEERERGETDEEIRTATGLPRRTLDAIFRALEGKELVRARQLTARGDNLVEAIRHARSMNDDPIRGLFASSAPPAEQFVRVGQSGAQREYPRSWPPPPFDRRTEQEFTRATDEALPEMLIELVADPRHRGTLAGLQSDDRLRVFLRRDGHMPWRAAYLSVPEHWILAGLWSAFDAVGEPPYRPTGREQRCRKFLMVRLTVTSTLAGEVREDTVFFEPNTRTSWVPRFADRLRAFNRRSTSFPEMPAPESLVLGEGMTVEAAVPDSWCLVEV